MISKFIQMRTPVRANLHRTPEREINTQGSQNMSSSKDIEPDGNIIAPYDPEPDPITLVSGRTNPPFRSNSMTRKFGPQSDYYDVLTSSESPSESENEPEPELDSLSLQFAGRIGATNTDPQPLS